MGFFKGLKKIAGGLLGAFAPAIGGLVGGPAGAAIGSGISKIPGIPGLGGATGRSLGRDARDYFDEAYPGTTPWERLGGSGYAGAGVEASKETARSAERMQDKELATRTNIAGMQAKAQTQSAAIQFGGKAVAGVDKYRRTGVTADYDTPATLAARRFQDDVAKVKADTTEALQKANRDFVEALRTGIQFQIDQEFVKYKDIVGKARATKEITPSVYATIINSAAIAVKGAQKMYHRYFKGNNVPRKTSVNRKPIRGSTHYKNQ